MPGWSICITQKNAQIVAATVSQQVEDRHRRCLGHVVRRIDATFVKQLVFAASLPGVSESSVSDHVSIR